MSPLFGKKKPEGKTLLVLDIEQGSVGSALVRVSKNSQPRLFGETRVSLPLFDTHHSGLLAKEVEKAVREALIHGGTVAGRLRNAQGTGARFEELKHIGAVDRVAVFLGAPWGTPNLSKGKPDFAPGMQEFLVNEAGAFAEDTPLSFYTAAGAATRGYSFLYPGTDAIVCIVGGEIIELILLHNGEARGYATLPQGYRTLMRTLKTHGAISEAEALSALKLGHAELSYEPLTIAARHLTGEFGAAVQHFVAEAPVENIFVIANEPVGGWVARALAADDSVSALFPQGGGVRALKARHMQPHIAAHSPQPDHALMLEALYINSLL